jgi:hypothetical protein
MNWYSNSRFKKLSICSILKPQQVKIIESTMSKRDCMVVMPTSDGKSACLLIPGVMEKRGNFRRITIRSFNFGASQIFASSWGF